MGTGWRRAFCTTIPKDREINIAIEEEVKTEQFQEISKPCPSPRGCTKFAFSSITSKNSTPRLQSNSPKLSCRTNGYDVQTSSNDSPKLRCKTNTPKTSSRSPRTILGSNPSSPRSPFSILKNSLRLSRNNCGVCMQSVKRGQGMAIYTAECSHAFHFPCIVEFLRKQNSVLICPICKSPWKDVPLLTIHNHQNSNKNEEKIIYMDPKTPPKFKQQIPSRTYNDDEPLISPKFTPILEDNEEQEADEVGEFQGFFVNSKPSDEVFTNRERELRHVEVSLLPEACVVSAGQTNDTVACVLRVKAPPRGGHNGNSPRRVPIDLVAVLDVSGGMSGAKLKMLKRAVRLVISSLGSADRLSIVSFSANPKRVMAFRRMNSQGQRAARRVVDRLVCNQGTCVNEALRKASKILEDRRERNPVATIVLLSEGQEQNVQTKNENQRQRSSHVSTTRFSHIEIPVDSYGSGDKPGHTNDPGNDPFSKCLGGLLSVVVQDLRVQLSFGSGSDPAEILAVYSCNGQPACLGSDFFRVGNLYAEEEKEFLVEMRIPKSLIGLHHVLSVKCSYKDPTVLDLVYSRECDLLVPKPQAIRSDLSENERFRYLFIYTRAIAESQRLLEHNELNRAMQLLSSARTLVMQSKCDSVEEHVSGLEAALTEVQWKMQNQRRMMNQVKITRKRVNEQGVSLFLDENGEPLTPISAWKAAEKLAKLAMMKNSFSRVSDLHGLENARF